MDRNRKIPAMIAMNNEVRQILCDLLAHYGHSICNDPYRCKALLKDYCGQQKREISILIASIKAQIPRDLINASKGFHIFKPNLINRLHEHHGIAHEFTEWAVDSWAFALENSEIRFAAKNGNADAQNALGSQYRDGTVCKQDYLEAVKWYRLAADQGHADAQINLGLIYQNGRGVQKSDQ